MKYVGEYQAAIPQFKTSLALSSRDSDYPRDLGNCYSILNQNDEAEKWYLKAMEMTPDCSICHQEFTDFLCWNMADLETAEIHFKRVIELQSEDNHFWAAYARFLIQQGNILKFSWIYLNIVLLSVTGYIFMVDY